MLVIPSVLAMLGDNPLQSEIACHVGLMGHLFCCVCWASRGKDDSSVERFSTGTTGSGLCDFSREGYGHGDLSDDTSDYRSVGSQIEMDGGVHSEGSQAAAQMVSSRRWKQQPESMSEMIFHLKEFMPIGDCMYSFVIIVH